MANLKMIKIVVLLLVLQTLKAQRPLDFKTDVEKYAQLLNLPTLAVGVAKGDSLIFFSGIGFVSPQAQVPIMPDHIFSIASITKSFTSVLMQQLEAEGKLSLKDPIDKFPNKYFTKDRWTSNTTLAHLLSHTSESRPPGTNFVYNGSKYNVVFNAFAAINPPADTESISRPFTKEVERRILVPLKMEHTLVRYTEAEHSTLKNYVVTPYHFDNKAHKFIVQPVNLTQMECGPGYGMMSSMADLVKYSSALDAGFLISKQRYQKITSPFYTGSPYGEGWFTCNFEGIIMNWAYGYGSNDAALFLKVPSKNLTLILLSSCDLPSATIRLGYGNPLNSPVVCSFIRNFILNQPNLIQVSKNKKSNEYDILNKMKKSSSRIHIEEAFATATVALFSPTTNSIEKANGLQLLKFLMKNFPNDTIWQSTAAFDLIAAQDDQYVLRFASGVFKNFGQAKQNLHPATLYYAGLVQEKLKNTDYAAEIFTILAKGDAYDEQGYKFDALFKLAKYFQMSNPPLARHYLGNLVRYKEYIGVQDNQYKEAKEMISKL